MKIKFKKEITLFYICTSKALTGVPLLEVLRKGFVFREGAGGGGAGGGD